MRIGVDATCWANPRGYGRFTRELLPELAVLGRAHEFVCLIDAQSAPEFAIDAPNVRVLAVSMRHAPAEAASADGNRSPFDMLRLTRAVWRARVDVFFSPSVYTYFPLPPGLPAVVTVHDAIAERFPHLTVPSRRGRLFWNLKVGLALRQARLVLTVSEFAAADIIRVHRIDASRVRVALEAPAPAYRRPVDACAIDEARRRLDIPPGSHWFVYVGGFNPHKNVDVLVRAHAALVRRRPENAPYLVLVGPGEHDVFHVHRGIMQEIDACGTRGLVRMPGFISDDALRGVYAGAIAAVLPSMCEGFGLPAVEAAACGTPVVATRESPLPDLLEGGGIFVEPGDAEALTDALALVADAERRRALAARAREKALALSWSETARSTLAAIHEAAA
jgi:glycosyltransferase involved in cell wall biosynthesis